jgi:hypothetical protein
MDNFLVDDQDRVWMIDFQHVGVLPLPFRQYALYNIGNPFAIAVGRLLNIEPYDDDRKMVRAAAIIKMSAGGSLG